MPDWVHQVDKQRANGNGVNLHQYLPGKMSTFLQYWKRSLCPEMELQSPIRTNCNQNRNDKKKNT